MDREEARMRQRLQLIPAPQYGVEGAMFVISHQRRELSEKERTYHTEPYRYEVMISLAVVREQEAIEWCPPDGAVTKHTRAPDDAPDQMEIFFQHRRDTSAYYTRKERNELTEGEEPPVCPEIGTTRSYFWPREQWRPWDWRQSVTSEERWNESLCEGFYGMIFARLADHLS